MRQKLIVIFWYAMDRLDEPSTWQAVGFIAGFCGARWAANIDAGGAAAVGGFVSAAIKAVIPDSFKLSNLAGKKSC